MRLDSTGKVTLDHIYNQADPRPYFETLRRLDYHIPQLAKPYFRALIDSYRASRGVQVPRVLDIGSSYGINAALLRCDASMDELYVRYEAAADHSRDELLAADRELVGSRPAAVVARFMGLDISVPALDYACSAGFLDDAVYADLERSEPTVQQRAQLAGTDLVISTGCLGYVGADTLSRVVSSCERAPVMAHFVLRMFPYDPITECLDEFGYRTVQLDGLFKQRRFASVDEQEHVLETICGLGVDPSGVETTGWLYAQLYLSLPPARDSADDTAEFLKLTQPVRQSIQ